MRRLLVCAGALCLSLCLVMALPARAQTTPITISLDSATLELQTGQEYEINIWLDNAAEVWLVNAEIAYDPALIYVMGTKSGQPVRQGPLFDVNQSLVIRNAVQPEQIIYTLSMLAPAQPVSGSGIVGTFRIYPLAPGATQLSFSRVAMNKVTQVLENGTPVDTQTDDLAFVPAMIQLTISGSAVQPPSEATATPAPTETTFLAVDAAVTVQATLVNVTAGPRPQSTATPVVSQSVDTGAASSSGALPAIAFGLIAVAVVGLGVLFVMSRRSRR